MAYRSFQFLEFEVRGVRKVTTGEHHLVVLLSLWHILLLYVLVGNKTLYLSTCAYIIFVYNLLFLLLKGITGLWQPSVHSDVAF